MLFRSRSQSAVVLLSGGLDSTTTLALAARDGYTLYALTIRYGQRHAHEVDAARRIASGYHVLRHEIIDIDLATFGGSALTAGIAIPKDRDLETQRDIPVTYVPARNTIFLSYALAFAEVTGASDIFIGVNHQDYSGYPDCRPEFIEAFQRMASLATKAGVEGTQRLSIHTPLIQMSKAQIIRRGLELGVDYSPTITCYDPSASGAACGRCDACLLRLKGFEENGIADPAPYQKNAR